MLARRVFEYLRESGDTRTQYFGAEDSEFHGFSVSTSRSKVAGRCYFAVDDSWPFESSWPSAWKQHAINTPEHAMACLTTAFENGATTAVISRQYFTTEAQEAFKARGIFVVDDSYQFYFDAGESLRALSPSPIVTAITGSVGKTTTTAMLAHAMRGLDLIVFESKKSQNIGVSAIRTLSHAEDSEHAVIEISHGACRSFKSRGRSIRADVAVVTAIAEAHLDTLGTLRDVAQVKAAIFDGASAGSHAVINRDTPHFADLLTYASKAGRQVITYGESADADIQLVSYRAVSGRVIARIGSESFFEFTLGMRGRHNALNSLAVLAVLRAHGVQEWASGMQSLSTLHELPGRGELLHVVLSPGTHIHFVNEAYNANPASMRAAIESFCSGDNNIDGARRVAVLGDILELGQKSREIHRSLASLLAQGNIDLLVLFGTAMADLHNELDIASVEHEYFATLEDMTSSFPGLVRNDDRILVKASHATGLFDWVSSLAN